MRVLLSAFGPRAGVDPGAGLAVRLRALDTQVRVCTPPDCAAAEGCAAPIATGVVPAGLWR